MSSVLMGCPPSNRAGEVRGHVRTCLVVAVLQDDKQVAIAAVNKCVTGGDGDDGARHKALMLMPTWGTPMHGYSGSGGADLGLRTGGLRSD